MDTAYVAAEFPLFLNQTFPCFTLVSRASIRSHFPELFLIAKNNSKLAANSNKTSITTLHSKSIPVKTFPKWHLPVTLGKIALQQPWQSLLR